MLYLIFELGELLDNLLALLAFLGVIGSGNGTERIVNGTGLMFWRSMLA